MHKANVDSSLGPPVKTDSMMNGHWDRLTSQQRYVHIQHTWLHKPGFARNILSLDALSLRDTIPDSILNFDRGVCLCTPKAIQIAEFCKDSRILNEDGGRAEKI